MKKFRIVITVEADEETFKEMKNMILSGQFQIEGKKDTGVKKLKATFEEIKK